MKKALLATIGTCGLIVVLTMFALLGCGNGTVTTTAATAAVTTAATAAPTTAATSAATTPSTQAPGTTQAAATKTLKIGSIVPLSMTQGLEIQKWMQLFADMKNESGGWKIGNDVYTVEYTAYDGGYHDPAKTKTAVEKAVSQDHVQFLVSDWVDVVQATLTVTEPQKVLVLGWDMSGEGVKPTINYYFNASGIHFMSGLNYAMFHDMQAKGATTYLTAGMDNAQGKAIIGSAVTTAKLVGLTALDPLFAPQDTVDYGPLATKVMSQNPSYFDCDGTTGDQLLSLHSALKDVGYKGLITAGNLDVNTLNKAVTKLGKEWFEGMETTCTDPRPFITDPSMKDLIDRYVAKYGEFKADGCLWVTPWFFFEDAVNATQSVDTTALANYLADSKHPVQAVTGYAQLVARPDIGNLRTVDAVLTNELGVIKDGQLVPLKVVSLLDTYLASVMGYGQVDAYKAYWNEHGKPAFPEQTSLLKWSDVGM
jgi:branched-chain amino acid transport system substrate-binding protein